MRPTSEDLTAVRAVLSGRVSLTEMTQTYTPRQATLVCATILLAVDKTTFHKGEFGGLMEHLARVQGMPEAGWQFEPANGCGQPNWYSEKSAGDLIKWSRRYELYTSPVIGWDLCLRPHLMLVRLIAEDPGYARRCRAYYERTCYMFRQPGSFAGHTGVMSMALHERFPGGHLDLVGLTPAQLRQAAADITAIVDQFFPTDPE